MLRRKRKHRTKCDRVCLNAETPEQKENRLSKPRTSGRARCAAGYTFCQF